MILLASFNQNSIFKSYFHTVEKSLNDDTILFAADREATPTGRDFFYQLRSKKFLSFMTLIDTVRFIRLLRKHQFLFSTIWFDSPSPFNILFSLFARLEKKRIWISLHDVDPHPGRKALLVDIYNRLCVILSNGLVVASYYSERRLSEQFPDVPVMVRRISGLSEPSLREGIGNYAIWFGRSETYKGLESIGPIAKNLCERAPKLRILVAGRGVTNRLNGAEKFNNVDVLDEYINDEELADLVARSFCCILPYTSATQSGVAVFSLGMGVPVVAFDLGAFSEQIINNENGLLVQPGAILMHSQMQF